MGALSESRRRASRLHHTRPFITDLGSGGRTEFTGAVFEQWVAKTANYLEAEFGSGIGIHLELRAHWLWPVMLAALDEIGGAITPRSGAELLMRLGVAPDADVPVLAVRDHPMALPFDASLPPMHHDFFREVRGGADSRGSGPEQGAALIVDDERTWSALDLVAATPPLDPDQRLAALVGPAPLSTVQSVIAITVLPWVSGASLVIAENDRDLDAERITVRRDLR